jgi:hypothetical protein
MGEHDVPELLAPALRDAIVATEPGLAGQYAFSHALIREVLCGELEPMHAAAVHWQVARALEELYGDDERRLIELAHHSYEGAPAGDPDKAFGYALRAAEQARARLAYEQAEQQLRRALELVERVRSRPERAARELEAQLQLGALLMMTMGYADPAVEETCRRAEQLCLQIGDEDRLLPSLWRLGVFYEVRAEFARQEAIGGRLMELANRSGDPNARLSAIMMLAPPAIHRGELKHAADLLKDAIRLADRCDPSGLVEAFGQNHQVTARGFLAWVGSLVDSERGETQLLDEALHRARQVGSPLDEAFALFLDAFCAAIREDAARARRQASAVKALSLEHGFPVFCAMGTMIHGWAIAASADPESGCEALVRGLADFEATGARMLLHFYFALLADAQRRAGRLERALAAVEAGLSHVDASTRFYAAELHRLKGSLLVELRPESGSEAEEARRTAISIASEQNARTLERRANAGLARR